MSRRASIVALAALPCVALASPVLVAQAGEPLHLECAGPFGPDSSEAFLAQVFGADNVVSETIDGPEGTTLDSTLLFPDDPERRLIILWQDEVGRIGPAAIIVRDDATWIGPGGVHLGSGLDEVEAINGAPFRVLGFGWDYGGAASFPSGRLSAIPGGCVMSLSFDIDWTLSYGPEFDVIMGDQELDSNDEMLRAAHPRVSEIAVGYPQ
jgi:hypothetical protein